MHTTDEPNDLPEQGMDLADRPAGTSESDDEQRLLIDREGIDGKDAPEAPSQNP